MSCLISPWEKYFIQQVSTKHIYYAIYSIYQIASQCFVIYRVYILSYYLIFLQVKVSYTFVLFLSQQPSLEVAVCYQPL